MKEKKIISLLIAILMLTGTDLTALADTGINNTIIGVSQSQNNSCYELLMASGDTGNITMPDYSSYLSSPRMMYVDANGKHSNNGYRGPRADKNKIKDYPFHGSRVTEVARQNGFSCIVYYDQENRQRAAWVDSSGLETWFTGNRQTVGRQLSVRSNYYGDVDCSWSRDPFVGTRQKYTVFPYHIYSCVQFTLSYQVTARNGASTKQVLGSRTVYVNDGSGWIAVGQFNVNELNAYEITVYLPEVMNVVAVATVAACEKPDQFIFRQRVLDVYAL